MATYTKYNTFVSDLANKVHDILGTAGSTADTMKVMLSNTAPNAATHTVRADVTELSTANGYTSGGTSIVNAGTMTTGTLTVATTATVVFTASGGNVGPFRYAIVYNDTPTSPADPLVCYFDYGSSITLADTETFTITFGANLFTAA